MIELQKQGIVDGELGLIMNSIREATKVIACLIRRAPLQQADLLGLQGEVNVQGEDQKKLDVITNDVMKSALRYNGKLGTLASEEEDHPVVGTHEIRYDDGEVISRGMPLVSEGGSYVCVFDPLDGSSNVDAGIAVGTIFGIFKEPDECEISDNMTLSEQEVQCLAGTLQ